MPPLDLTSQRFGKLLVLRAGAPIVSNSGTTQRKSWVCICDCGREETLPARRIPYCPSNERRSDAALSCAHCRSQRVCAECGKSFESVLFRACCSDACHLTHQRGKYLDDYYRRVARDPMFNKKRGAVQRARKEVDPEFSKKLIMWAVARGEHRKILLLTDPNYRDKTNTLARERYAEQSREIQARRQERRAEKLAAMTDIEFDIWQEKQRDIWRRYAQKYRSTPEIRTRYNENMRRYLQKQALVRLAAIGENLINRNKR